MFLNINELKTVATREVIDLITNNDDRIVTEIIEESIDLMKSYLFKYYDTERIFNSEDNERPKIVLKYLKDIVIHEVYIRRTRQLNEVAKIRYDEAMLWLEKLARGEIEANLLKKGEDTNGDGTIDDTEQNGGSSFLKLGSRRTYKNHW